ncbi:hypothetical protein [Kurthia massiliensis]|uniref:hypothetical protein n=1 Tax=Kurthia massiliensis TaxID=1033739 RepID=UPI0002889596|nr:hypothetical protein [Kurthia massiliensis]
MTTITLTTKQIEEKLKVNRRTLTRQKDLSEFFLKHGYKFIEETKVGKSKAYVLDKATEEDKQPKNFDEWLKAVCQLPHNLNFDLFKELVMVEVYGKKPTDKYNNLITTQSKTAQNYRERLVATGLADATAVEYHALQLDGTYRPATGRQFQAWKYLQYVKEVSYEILVGEFEALNFEKQFVLDVCAWNELVKEGQQLI